MTGAGDFQGTTLHVDDLVQPVGGRFGAGFDSAEVQRLDWGELTLEFEDFWNGQVAWNSRLDEYGSGSYPIRLLTRPMLASCD